MASLKEDYSEKKIGDETYRWVLGCIEECESTKFSIFVDVKGEVFPCSFMAKELGWETGIDLTDEKYKNYMTQVWNHPRLLEWRQQAMMCRDCNGKCKCPHYEI
jgi:radical SAM protein with 4Fe4S-binding SPASM domain